MSKGIAKPLLNAALLAVALTACRENFRVEFGGDNGIEGHRQRDLPAFEAFEVRGSVQLDIDTGGWASSSKRSRAGWQTKP